ncbi:ABC transporter substrate-binding protein [Streptomyces profundus]|uniref:ABC transporter substrate-binding protein n=1 Tax=Streptomyces profundus TaxID=2867410 RepID=UPI001D1639E8|nr:ABC transporter substrate-binding protein [Streptomyces sp. MA3_2.13]UED87975.1 ABC transporter substrate-binding protein [Streptomyces sp. MA3_2.13]
MNDSSARRTGRFARLAATLAGAAVLAACSTTTSGGEGGEGGGTDELTAAGTYPVESLDPHGAQGASTGTQFAGQALFSRLVKPNPDGTLTGDLAESWEPNEDVTAWTFTLRAGVTFSDGSPLTAEDVVASFERMLELAGPNAGNFPGATVAATSDTEVVLTTPEPDAAIPGKLVLFYVLPAGVAADDTAFFNSPVGSGPFTVDRFTPGETLSLVPNEDHWGEVPRLDRVTVRNIPELSARLTALRTGEVDVVWGIPDDQLPVLEGEDALTVETVPSTAEFTMWFNSSVPALEDAAVRRALWQAVDFETIIEQLYPETGELALAPVTPVVLGHAPQEPVAFAPEAALAALEDAGFDFSQKLRLQFANAEFRPFLQAVASDLAEIGVRVEPLEKEQAVFTDDLLALNWDINFQQLATPTFDAASNLGRLYTCEAARNGYCDPELDELLARAGGSADEAERTDLYDQASAIIWNEAVGMYPMTVSIAYAWNSDLEGFVPDPSGLPDFSVVRGAGS